MNVTFVTCFNDLAKYLACVVKSLSLEDGLPKNVAISAINNQNNKLSSPYALNLGIANANSEIVVCCHQDIIFYPGWVDRLEQQIAEVEECWGKGWGVLGTFGVTMMGRLAGNIDDPHQVPPTAGLPLEAQSLDEHCLILRKSSGLMFDPDLGGHHFYGADICIRSRLESKPCAIIDNRLTHLSPGKIDGAFHQIRQRFEAKWRQDRFIDQIITTCGEFSFAQ